MSAQPVDDNRIEADQTISRAVAALIGWHGMKPAALAEPLGTSDDTVNRRLKCEKPWTASEVATLAAYFGVPIGDLYSGRVDLANSVLHTDVRLSRDTCAAGDAPFSGSDIDAFLDAAEVAMIVPVARAG